MKNYYIQVFLIISIIMVIRYLIYIESMFSKVIFVTSMVAILITIGILLLKENEDYSYRNLLKKISSYAVLLLFTSVVFYSLFIYFDEDLVSKIVDSALSQAHLYGIDREELEGTFVVSPIWVTISATFEAIFWTILAFFISPLVIKILPQKIISLLKLKLQTT